MKLSANPRLRALSLAVLVLSLSACSRGIDRQIVDTQGDAPYRASLEPVEREATKDQLAAYNWAVSDLNLDLLKSRYPDRSPRDIIHGEADRVVHDYPATIADLDGQLAQWKASADKIGLVQVESVGFTLEKDFFGLQPTIAIRLRNAGPLSYSSYGWKAQLYLDDQSEPVATAEVSTSFRGTGDTGGGLDPGGTATASIQVGFVSGDEAWKTLEVQRAARRTVKLVPMPERARDLGDRAFVGPSPAARLASMKATLEQARAYQKI